MDVVPYSPWLTLRHGAHVNVEVVASSTSPKYLTKYFVKGGSVDRAMVGEVDKNNEVEQFLSWRVVGAHSAMLALRRVPELQLDPPVDSLALHLPGQKQVVVRDDAQTVTGRRAAMQAALDRAVARNTMLEAFFLLNRCGEEALNVEATTLPYELIPNYFTWDSSAGLWQPRKRAGVQKLGRIRWCHPKCEELFYLRRLLMSPQGDAGRGGDVVRGASNGWRWPASADLQGSVCAARVDGGLRRVLRLPEIVSNSDDVPFGWVRQQFPLQLCFATTINKSQGQTLRSRVGVVLTSPCWTHGQTYVALGRVTDPANLRVAAPANCNAVVNVVYKDVLKVGEARGV